jgi:hypothetical protein
MLALEKFRLVIVSSLLTRVQMRSLCIRDWTLTLPLPLPLGQRVVHRYAVNQKTCDCGPWQGHRALLKDARGLPKPDEGGAGMYRYASVR